LSQTAAEHTAPAASPTPFDLLVDSRRPLISRYNDRIPAIRAALSEIGQGTSADQLRRAYLSWIKDLPASRNVLLDRAYQLAEQLGRSEADDWHESYTTAFVIDYVLPSLESEFAAAQNAKGAAH